MTIYAYYQTKMDEYTTRALRTDDVDLKRFYANAAEGFRLRLEELSAEEVGHEVLQNKRAE